MRKTRAISSIYLQIFLLTGLLFSFSGISQAAVCVDGLYEVEVPVSDQGGQERARAIRHGMVEVMTRISGSQGLEQFGELLGVLDHAARYVLQYRYLQKPSPTDAQPGSPPELIIWIKYDRKTIDRLLQQYHLPVWSETRSETLIWLALEDRGERYLLGGDFTSDIKQSLLDHAKRRGIPILFPLLDLEDQQLVRAGDVWGGFTDVLRKGSERYAVDNALAGRVFRGAGGKWEGKWIALTPRGEFRWSVSGGNLEQVLGGGIDGLADQLASIYAFRSDTLNTSTFYLDVTGIGGLDDYARLQEYLASIEVITDVHPVRVEQDHMVYELKLLTELENLKQLFSLGSRLVPVEEPPVVPENQKDLSSQKEKETDAMQVQPPHTMYYRLQP